MNQDMGRVLIGGLCDPKVVLDRKNKGCDFGVECFMVEVFGVEIPRL